MQKWKEKLTLSIVTVCVSFPCLLVFFPMSLKRWKCIKVLSRTLSPDISANVPVQRQSFKGQKNNLPYATNMKSYYKYKVSWNLILKYSYL